MRRFDESNANEMSATIAPASKPGFFFIPLMLLSGMFRLIEALATDVGRFINDRIWSRFATGSFHASWHHLMACEFLAEIFLLLWSVGLLRLYIKQDHRFRICSVAFILTAVVILVADFFVANDVSAIAANPDATPWKELVGGVGSAIFLLLYFWKSKRLRRIFP